MTKTMITSYALLLFMALAAVGAASAEASEVTGTLSSDTSVGSDPTGNITGTVTSTNGGDGGSSSGGSRSNGNSSGSSSNAPSGEVLGASTDNMQTPSFPNAGSAPDEVNTAPSYWSVMITFFRGMFSF